MLCYVIFGIILRSHWCSITSYYVMELISMPMGNINSHWHHTTFFSKSGFLFLRNSDFFKAIGLFFIYVGMWTEWLGGCASLSQQCPLRCCREWKARFWMVWKICIFLAYRCYYKGLFTLWLAQQAWIAWALVIIISVIPKVYDIIQDLKNDKVDLNLVRI